MSDPSTHCKRWRRRWTLTALLAVALALGGWWVYTQYDLDRHWQAAQQALERYDVWRAQEVLRPCLSAWPDRFEVRLTAARVDRLADALDQAEFHLAWCERQAAAAPAEAEAARFERMLLQLQQGDLKPYEPQMRSWPQLPAPRQLQVYFALAIGSVHTHNVNQALQCLARTDAIDSAFTPSLWLHSKLHMRFKRHDEALSGLTIVVAALPDALPPRLQLAECLMMLGRPREALVHLERLRSRWPLHADVALAVARCSVYCNDLDEARRVLDRLLLDQPTHAEALIERGRLEFRVGDLTTAAGLLHRALDVEPDHIVAWRVLEATTQAQESAEYERCRLKVERLDRELGQQQRRELRLLRQAHPKVAELFELGERWRSLHHPREAEQWYARALQEDPNHSDTHRALAELLESADQPHRAARHRRLAEMELDP